MSKSLTKETVSDHAAIADTVQLGVLMKRFLAALAAIAALAFTATAAGAAPAVSTEVTRDNVFTQHTDNACTGDMGTETDYYTVVFHTTALANGTVHFHATFTGTFEFVPDDPSRPSLSAHFVNVQQFNLNNQNEVFTLTVPVTGTLSDGSRARLMFTTHVTLDANGDVAVEFDRLRCA